MKAYVLIETAAGKTKNVKKSLTKIKSPRATVAAMDAVTGPYDFIAVVDGLLDGRLRPSQRRSPFFAIPFFRTNFRRMAGAIGAAAAVLAGWWIFR